MERSDRQNTPPEPAHKFLTFKEILEQMGGEPNKKVPLQADAQGVTDKIEQLAGTSRIDLKTILPQVPAENDNQGK